MEKNMGLPKLSHPTFELTLPSSGEKIRYRPFLVKEEKILLIAKESKDESDVIRCVTQIVNNCVLEDGFDIEKLPSFDLEYIFIQLRSKSVGNIIEATVVDTEDNLEYDFTVDLDKIKVIKPEGTSNKIYVDANQKIGVIMRYPTTKDIVEITKKGTKDIIGDMFMLCVEKVFDDDDVYPWNEHTIEEKTQFFESIDGKKYESIVQFFADSPRIEHVETYTNSKGKEKKVYFRKLDDFFTF
jgi:hypothetical protein